MLDLLKSRRSIRKFKNMEVEKEKIEALVKGALLSPSSKNTMPWEFIVVTDKNTLGELALSKKAGSAFLKEAPLGIVVLGDPNISDVWVEDTSIATIIIQLVAESMGLGSCWIQIRERKHNEDMKAEEHVRKTLNIPENMRVESIVAIGYPDENKEPRSEESLKYDKVFFNSYENKYTP
ncbi:nitroreductase family protein [Clostridium sp. MSJ-11]|uniref:Nitroreductase family protein n=1 Tax=Clostridium mobile TaxID=2841512 RepID=A0ABS6EH86_9CLOT|nr:nitroreductase family protein [Clostridium mobile]MBU5484579.1 nitroreductase family protein [Clostridium mobile]